jgi:ribosome-binding protein aMBF1 (putative translation factor)
MRRRVAEEVVDGFIKIDKLRIMSTERKQTSPSGTAAADAARRLAERSEDYRRDARDEYAAIRELREKNWIAAHIRERRYELDLTQKDVAERAGTSHSFISKLEAGNHIPTIPVLKRILAVLDEELLIGIERHLPDEEPEREVAPVPDLAGV